MNRELLQHALDALNKWAGVEYKNWHDDADVVTTVTALQAELAKPPIAPVRWLCEWHDHEGNLVWEDIDDQDPSTTQWDDEPPTVVTPLYAGEPPQAMIDTAIRQDKS